ncbi:alpha-ketoglutarate-dependent dioxygenase AlkB family protein [Atopomonas hussainii]|uniref:alpha-ketoglutarate-dependent dioxygenase AlkB family protein n=1 Tax=Atopomonas hussainii TaxID=1429083 RepID=UPI0009003FC2|nr:alpha-ketoglutarate-dependent dioxygenase AlkB [Atopomonas hussainii]
MRSDDLQPGTLYWHDDFASAAQADQWFSALQTECAWQQPQVKVFGRWHPTPRLVAWYGDSDAAYRYSGQTHRPLAWTPTLSLIRDLVEQQTGRRFNGVLVNYYRNGHDSMGWHSDDERELGPEPWLASLSLGVERRFDLRRKGSTRIAVSFALKHGQLLLMDGQCQAAWQHQVPRSLKVSGARINLTFRHILHPASYD